MFAGQFFQTDEGIRGAIRPLLCNIALHGLEAELGVRLSSKVDKKVKAGFITLICYADDILIFTYIKADASKALNELDMLLGVRGLQISSEKTRIKHITEKFDFLGFHVTSIDAARRNPDSQGTRRTPFCVLEDVDFDCSL